MARRWTWTRRRQATRPEATNRNWQRARRPSRRLALLQLHFHTHLTVRAAARFTFGQKYPLRRQLLICEQCRLRTSGTCTPQPLTLVAGRLELRQQLLLEPVGASSLGILTRRGRLRFGRLRFAWLRCGRARRALRRRRRRARAPT